MTAWRRPAAIVSRTAAAILGGYALAALAAICCAAILPGSRMEATLAGMLASFLVHAGAVLWVFAARSAWRGWAGLAAAALPMGAALAIHGGLR